MDKTRFEYTLVRYPTALLWQLFFAAVVYFFNTIGWDFRNHVGDLAISSIWPAAGISLGLLLLFGKKAIYGILLGNIFYEFTYPHREWLGYFFHTISALGLATGQSLGAYTGYYLLKRFAYKGLFHSVLDSTLFILLGAIVSSMILPFFMILLLSADSQFHWGLVLPKGLEVWFSNISGVMIFTPPLLVWGRNTQWRWRPLAFVYFLLFIAGGVMITYLASEIRYGLIYLYLPLLIWTTFALGEIGATLSTLAFSIAAVAMANVADFVFVIAFVDIIAATILILLGALEENQAAQEELKAYSNNLESKVQLFAREQSRREAKANHENLAHALSIGVAHQMQNPIEKIAEFSEGGGICASLIFKEFQRAKPSLSYDTFATLEANFKTLTTCLESIQNSSVQAAHLLKIMNQQTIRDRGGSKEFKQVDLHALLNSSLGRNLAKQTIIAPDFKVSVVKKYSPALGDIRAIAGDLDQTFYHLFDNALYAMKEKFERGIKGYRPELFISTEQVGDQVEIIIRDNGIGIPQQALFKIFQPFYTTKSSGEFSGVGLTIAFEITEREHHGKIVIDSKEGEFTTVKITLPIHGS